MTQLKRQSGEATPVFLVVVPLIAVIGIVAALLLLPSKAHGAIATNSTGFPVDLQVTSAAMPGSLHIGDSIIIKITVRNTSGAALRLLQVGFPQTEKVLSSSRPLISVKGVPPIWNVGGLTKSGPGAVKSLTLKVEVTPPPDNVHGPMPWCFPAIAAPRLQMAPQPWAKSEEACYNIDVP